jgi:hypothetical protein
MGNCLKCGVKYCDCPADGYCDKCLNNMFSNGNPNTACKYTQRILNHYSNILVCLKSNPNSIHRLGLTLTDVSTYHSYVLSALNFPNNYCQYEKILNKLTPVIQLANSLGLCQM